MSGHYVVMGVSGCGKSSVGERLAAVLGGSFTDGDDLHPEKNIAKMARGEPLDDADRAPWLDRVGATLRMREAPAVIACSALRHMYRDRIRQQAARPVMFMHLTGSRAVIAARMAARNGHFMPPALLDSQLAALEAPDAVEAAITVDLDQPLDRIIAALLAGMEKEIT